jgi:hypothetical protein
VRVFVDEILPPGEYRREVDLQGIKPGTFVCRLTSGAFSQTRKLVIIE